MSSTNRPNATVIPDGYVRFHFGLSVIASPTIEGMREIATRFTNTQSSNSAPAPTVHVQTNQPSNPQPHKRKISAASRKKMAEAQNKRWEAKRAAAGTPAKPVVKATSTRTRKAAKPKTMTAAG